MIIFFDAERNERGRRWQMASEATSWRDPTFAANWAALRRKMWRHGMNGASGNGTRPDLTAWINSFK